MKFNIGLPEPEMEGYKMRHLYPMETKRYTVETEINNVASIVDAMIRVTAKLTKSNCRLTHFFRGGLGGKRRRFA